MCLDEKVRGIIPSQLAYGERGNEDLKIPPNADIHIEIELTNFKVAEKPKDEFSKIDKNEDNYISESEMIEDLLMQNSVEFEFMIRRGDAKKAKKLADFEKRLFYTW